MSSTRLALADSIAQNTRQADLVVRGPMADLYIGEYWNAREGRRGTPLAYVKVRVDEVLKGEPASRTSGYVEVQVGGAGPDLEEIRARLPAHDNLWFLTYDWPYRDDPVNRSTEIARFAYFLKDGLYQGVFRDVDGVVEVVTPDLLAEGYGLDTFPLPLDGASFEDVVAQVRDTPDP